jgi:hypothetical protein
LRSLEYLIVCGFVLLTTCWPSAPGCSPPSKGRKMLTLDQAVEVAKKEFSKHGRQVSDYDITAETYRADEKQWIVWFDLKGPFRTPGGKHAVLVHKTTGHAVYMPGE